MYFLTVEVTVKGAGNSLVFQNPNLYYIILRTVKHVWRVSQAIQNFTVSLTPYQPSPTKNLQQREPNCAWQTN